MKLDHNSSVPLYGQLAEVLQQEINAGIYPAGAQLPTEQELGARYKVSRVTVRKALEILTEGGYLNRRPGKGTFVTERKMTRGLNEVLSFSQICRMQGIHPGARTLKMALEHPTETEAEQLSLSPGEKIFVIRRLRLADGRPVVIETSKFRESFFFLLEEDLNDTSLYEIINRKTGVEFVRSTKTLEIVFAGEEDARYLGVTRGYPLLSVSGVAMDASGENAELSQQLCLGDRFKFII